MKNCFDSPMEPVKSCKTCAYRDGAYYNANCMLSGFHCRTERMHPTVCGRDYAGWVKRPKPWWIRIWA